MRLPFSNFVNNLFININHAPAQLSPTENIRSILPQDTDETEQLPWYTYVDEALLIKAGLVYDKEFDPHVQDDPPTWDELVIIASACPPDEVDLDAMLGERPSFFTRVKTKSKTKPREFMVPADFAPAAPCLPTTLPAPVLNLVLKRVAENIPASLSQPSKKPKRSAPKKKAASKV
ncbi:hypothetical protein LIER_13083 [Lithospermum erythrorhizon]|uniref:Uncharacterized protein n=1 Tax=Lithospermum erythrorhizon TaxID=34254 RepID=A0AAV3PU65_LITER